MFKIVVNEVISVQKYDIPKILPNNFELIKQNYGISNNDIAKALSLNSKFIDKVCKQEANFSGLSVIKFIKNFNIPFNLIFNVNKEVGYLEETYKRYICIIKVDKKIKYETEEQQKDLNGKIVSEVLEKSIFPQDSDCFVKFLLKVENNTLNYSKKIKSDNYNSDLSKYQEFVNNQQYDYLNFNYFALCYEIVENNAVTQFINLNKNFDIDLIRFLDSKPFFNQKLKIETIPKESLNLEDDTYILPKKYLFFKNDTVVKLDRIKKSDCIEKRKNIEIMVVPSTANQLSKFKYLREYKNFTIKDMAEKLCVSEDTYSAIERGYLKISAQLMWKIELEFGILLEYLLNIDEYYDKYCK
ncbi:helix-turn-helix transcriptional regulator [uncultured Clostridium sp.]|uniref:helix-turn-helix domain-containing protein n=1 Tax=uncultured Clostridium sp. TaxID=59620 RepID=UPI0028EED06B|nr:helix-turn-helix transcriptional regulator [uncultured Clostridium sp.]